MVGVSTPKRHIIILSSVALRFFPPTVLSRRVLSCSAPAAYLSVHLSLGGSTVLQPTKRHIPFICGIFIGFVANLIFTSCRYLIIDMPLLFSSFYGYLNLRHIPFVNGDDLLFTMTKS